MDRIDLLGRSLGPDNLKATGHLVRAVAFTDLVVPAKTHLSEISSLGLRANVGRRHSTVGLTEGVTTNDKSSSLLIVHTHTVESNADVKGRSLGVRASVGTLGVDVDETEVSSTKRLLELVGSVEDVGAAVVADIVALRDKGGLGSPVDGLIGLPGIGSATGETERLKVHALEGNVAGEKDQVSP